MDPLLHHNNYDVEVTDGEDIERGWPSQHQASQRQARLEANIAQLGRYLSEQSMGEHRAQYPREQRAIRRWLRAARLARLYLVHVRRRLA
ncbi:hypothetical protein B0H10DRAFT_2208933 [Mycena sp. CBHHK59/15]|nr:hypothetical protein B0H10DRAFT_2208933 [Mycena sp. CBHHK59/15]